MIPALLTRTVGAQFGDDGGEGRLDPGGVRDVHRDGERPAAVLLDRGDGVGALGGVQVQDGYGEAVGGQALGGGGADAACGTGDDGDTLLQGGAVGHGWLQGKSGNVRIGCCRFQT